MTANDAPRGPKLQFVALALALLASTYVALHLFWMEPMPSSAPGCSQDMGWRCFAEIDEQGRVRILDPRRAEWYLGTVLPGEVAWRAEANFDRMSEIRSELQEEMADSVAGLLIDRSAVVGMVAALERGEDTAATELFETVVGSLSLTSQLEIASRLSQIERGLERLGELRREQMVLVQTLAAPWPSPFFWQSPSRRFFEVMFWAGFGALFYLVACSVRDFVVFSRQSSLNGRGMDLGFIYGPILAVLISVILYEAWLRYGSQDGWFGWIVLVSFLLGYAAAALVFGLAAFRENGRVLERSSDSMTSLETSRRDSSFFEPDTARLKQPRNLEEMRADLKGWTREFVQSRVVGRGIR